jgi:hypothetical protein
MNLLRQSLLCVSIASALALGACAAGPMAATSTALTARLEGSSEVPVVATAATGTVEATLAGTGNVLRWKITYSGLSGPATGAHFHGPAMAGQNAGVVVPITGPLTSPLVGSTTLTPGQAAELTGGKWYVNLHTAAHPNGEVRGQVMLPRP